MDAITPMGALRFKAIIISAGFLDDYCYDCYSRIARSALVLLPVSQWLVDSRAEINEVILRSCRSNLIRGWNLLAVFFETSLHERRVEAQRCLQITSVVLTVAPAVIIATIIAVLAVTLAIPVVLAIIAVLTIGTVVAILTAALAIIVVGTVIRAIFSISGIAVGTVVGSTPSTAGRARSSDASINITLSGACDARARAVHEWKGSTSN